MSATITVYEVTELEQQAQDAAYEVWRQATDPYCIDHVFEYLTKTFEVMQDETGLSLDWSLGTYERCYIFAYVDGQEYGFDGDAARSMAWLENNLLAHHRVPWGIRKIRERHEYGYDAPGTLPDLPLTGAFTDALVIGGLIEQFRQGKGWDNAWRGLAQEIGEFLEEEAIYQTSRERFLEEAENEGWMFTASGQKVSAA